jgi:hypothetical protein
LVWTPNIANPAKTGYVSVHTKAAGGEYKTQRMQQKRAKHPKKQNISSFTLGWTLKKTLFQNYFDTLQPAFQSGSLVSTPFFFFGVDTNLFAYKTPKKHCSIPL